jgi:hypothetical protein
MISKLFNLLYKMSSKTSQKIQENDIEEQPILEERPIIEAKYKLTVHILCFTVIFLSLIKVFNAIGDTANILNPEMAGSDKELYLDRPIWPLIGITGINLVYVFGATMGLIAVTYLKIIYFYICITSSIIRILFAIFEIIYLSISGQFFIKSIIGLSIGGILISLTITISSFILVKQIRRVSEQ